MPDLDKIKQLDNSLDRHRSDIGSSRSDMKELYKKARKEDGIEVKGYKMAAGLKNLTPTKRSAVLASFRATLEALGLDRQIEMPFGVIDGGKIDAKKPSSLQPTRAKKTRGKGPLNRPEQHAAG